MFKLTITAYTESEPKVYSYEFDQPIVTMGRLKENDIQLPISTVSGYHAQIVVDDGNYYLIDRGSINGTYLNSQKMSPGERKLLQDGDRIKIQSFDIYFTTGLAMNVDQGATVQVARQMVMELLGSWESQHEPRLITMGGPNNGKQIMLQEGKTLSLGRSTSCDILIDHPTISRRHAEIIVNWNGTFIKDLESPNGIYINDLRITGTARLRDRDEIKLGQANNPQAIRFIFSNPAEGLLSKIEEAQITDGNPIVKDVAAAPVEAEAKPATPADASAAKPAAVPETPPPPAPAPEPEPAPPTPPVSTELQPRTPETPAPGIEPVPAAPKSSGFWFLLAAILVLAGGAAAIYYLTHRPELRITKIAPEKAAAGDIVTISTANADPQSIREVRISGKQAPVLSKERSKIQVRVPAFPDLSAGETQADIEIEETSGKVLTASFAIVNSPEIKALEPSSGKPGTEIRIMTNRIQPQSVEVLFGTKPAQIVSGSEMELIVKAPEPSDPSSGVEEKLPVVVKAGGLQSKNTLDFVLLPPVFVKAISPDSGLAGTEVRIVLSEAIESPTVQFGTYDAQATSVSETEISTMVPAPTETIPAQGISVPVIVKTAGEQVVGEFRFVILPQPERQAEVFELQFHAAQYSGSLGFNEYGVFTNIGAFLLLVAKDEYGSSQARAEAVARNLNSGRELYKQDASAKVATINENGKPSLVIQGSAIEKPQILLRAFPEDALAYGKLNRRTTTVEALAEWWRMLIDSYYKVFIQKQSPASTGILAAGGGILQQIHSFYVMKDGKGNSFFKKDFLESLHPEQKTALLALSLNPPKKLATVDGEWTGSFSNVLYSNISDKNLAILLNLKQKDGSISGTAEVAWKLSAGENKSGFENVIYKRLGIYNISGVYQKTKSYPLEFTFTDKERRQLKFVGKLEGDALMGSFAVSPGGKEGTWNARLKN